MSPDDNIQRAAAILRQGGLVAFPTETVYGLGADAGNEQAVARIYQAKGRPATSPLIVHVADQDAARPLVRDWPPRAEELAARFWPGPLTLILPKSARVSDRVTAGLPTVAIRVPNHPVALALLRAAECPVAAPSANRFMGLSPTRAEHVEPGLADLVLDGGPSAVGIESTVVSLVDGHERLLRPGQIRLPEWRLEASPVSGPHLSPGQHQRHYSPRTPLYLGSGPTMGRGVHLALPESPEECAAELYATLHKLDQEEWDWIVVEPPPPGPEWEAVRDRLQKAAGQGGEPDERTTDISRRTDVRR